MSAATTLAPKGDYSPVKRANRSFHHFEEGLDAKIKAVHRAVQSVYRVEAGILDHPTRGRSQLAFARQVAMYLAHVTFGLNLTTVGRAFGRDRTTVSHACALIEDARDDPDFDRTLEVLEAIAKHLASCEFPCR